MQDLKIYYYGSPILRREMPELADLPEDFEELVEGMFSIMDKEEGIGLSANQVGKEMRFFVADFSLFDQEMEKKVFINPEIIEMDGQTKEEEGCLSLPGISVKVERADEIVVKYRDRNMDEHTEKYSGYLSRVIQHETDHLNGKYMTDRISSLKRRLLDSKLEKIEKKAKEAVSG